jgi:hypothetical protein
VGTLSRARLVRGPDRGDDAARAVLALVSFVGTLAAARYLGEHRILS